ncbi:MAG: thioesterase [Saccharofermentans sp.]|nr:thioesterase [Saccharofermentans sp.]
MQYTYTKNFNTSYSSIDRTGKLGLVELMSLNQEMITEFYGSVGSDNLILREKCNAAWLYTRTKVKVISLPTWNTKTKAVAYITSMSPIRMEIEVDLVDEEGNFLFVAKTEMCAIDFEQRKLRKIDTLEFPQDAETMPSNLPEAFAKNRTQFDATDLSYSQKVYASDTDFTDHTNNVRYVKFLMNTFDTSFYDENQITGFEIQFAKESKQDDILDIYRKETSGNEYSFLINKGDEAIIKAVINYEQLK